LQARPGRKRQWGEWKGKENTEFKFILKEPVISDILELAKDAEVGHDIMMKAIKADWWNWSGGSTLIFWRWPAGN
jgi:hypothetical protein